MPHASRPRPPLTQPRRALERPSLVSEHLRCARSPPPSPLRPSSRGHPSVACVERPALARIRVDPLESSRVRSFSRSRHAASPFVVARVVERSTHSLTHSPFLSTRVVVSAATPAALESDDWTAFDEAVDAFNDDEDGPDGLLAIEKVMSLVPSLVAALESGAVDDGCLLYTSPSPRD